MRFQILALSALTTLVCLPASALAQQGARSPAETNKPASSTGVINDDALTDVDPAVLAQCKDSAATKRLKGAARDEFMRSCVTPED
jgi:psiF repeat-containing protein